MSQPAPKRKDSTASSVGSGYSSDGGDYNVSEYEDALEEVHTRFILNLPDSELQTADRMFFQLEQAWWFYEDWICDQRPDSNLPRFSTFKPFAQKLFEYSPLLPDPAEFPKKWQEFSTYKRTISTYGCILLSADYSKLILCQVWGSKTHTFPAGKINQGENGVAAAARETYEETGFDPLCMFGLTSEWKETNPEKITWKALKEQDALVYREENGKRRTCYICCGVPEDFPFEPVARKEVASINWFPLDDMPKKTFAVFPFMPQLRNWIKKKQKKGNKSARKKTPNRTPTRDRSRGKKTPTRTTPNRSRGKVREEDDLVMSGLASAGEASGWSEEDMFLANERLIGRKVEYDGNPHVFAEHGFGGMDPHAFRVVGGSFLNSEGIASLAPAPERSKLQPLFRKEDGDGELQPFFAEDGSTPWGEVVADAKGMTPARKKQDMEDAGAALLSMLRSSSAKSDPAKHNTPEEVSALDDVFLTDKEITARSQALKKDNEDRRRAMLIQYEKDMEFVRQWVARLPKPQPTIFGTFRLDADAIMKKASETVGVPL